MSRLRFSSRWAGTVAVVVLVAAMPALAAAQDSVSAVWVPRKVQFIYQGFGTQYSCEGLRNKVRSMLEKLGAEDLDVRPVPCATGVGVPSPYPAVRVKMRVLVPASSAEAAGEASAGAPVEAHWRKVVLMRPSTVDPGNCQLIEQFKNKFLPLLTTRNTRYFLSCVPYQPNLGTLSTEVLMPPAADHQS